MKKRVIALMLLMAMALTVLVACSDPGDTTAGNGGSNTVGTTIKPIRPHGVTLKGEGETINILSQNRDWYYDELTIKADEQLNVIDETVYNRELAVEEELNINIENEKITAETYQTVSETASRLFQSGTALYDVVMNSRTGGGNGGAINYNLCEVENIDLTQPWYNQGWIEANQADIVTSICGDATLSLLRFTFVTMCNTTMLAGYGVTDIYREVTNGTWTIDRQNEIVTGIYDDTNGSLTPDIGDTFGFVTNTCTAVDPYMNAFKQSIIAKNADGKFEFVLDVDRANDATTKLNNLFHNNPGTLILDHQAGTDGEYIIAMQGFSSDLYAFATFRLIAVEDETILNMESPYGILPMPKLNEDQDGYGSYFHDMHSLIGILGTVSEDKLPLVGAFIEVFSAYSYNHTRGIYLDTALKGRYFRDQQSRDVLDMVVESITTEAGIAYTDLGGGLFYMYRDFIGSNKNQWAGQVRAKRPIINRNLEKFNAGEWNT